MNEPAPPAPPIRSAPILGWLAVALIDAAQIASNFPRRVPSGVRAMVHFYDAGHVLALGLVASGLLAAYRRFGKRSRPLAYASLAAVSVLACGLVYRSLAEDLTGAADRLAVLPFAVWLPLLVLGTALTIPLAAGLGALVARPWLRVLGVVAGSALALGNAVAFTQNYPALHLVASVVAAVLIGASIEGSPLIPLLEPSGSRARAALTAALALFAAAALVTRPSNEVLIRLSRFPSAALAPFLAELRAAGFAREHIPEAQRVWFADRSALPPIPPSTPSILPARPIVILLGIDSMRAELLADDTRRPELPELFRLRDESVYFEDARSAGSSTGPSFAAIFSGAYYSQLHWTHRPDGHGLVYPHLDPTKRFPELLQAAGVRTVTFDGTGWLLNDFGIVRGFDEEETLRAKSFTAADRLIHATIGRLNEPDSGPLFLFVHLLDAHNPYTSAGEKGSKFEGYVAELGLVDKQLKRLRTALVRANLWDRTSLVVMADHGEAFGEHGTTWHAATLYDELLRVPLMIRVPGVAPRVVTDRVSLIDLGPTVLDLFGVATPGRSMGQSLTGFLRGQSPQLTRPIVAEARLKRMMLSPDGLKLIQDTRTHTVELYDVNRDPREETNLWADGASEQRLGVLRTFFGVHTLKRGGYKVPYRKW